MHRKGFAVIPFVIVAAVTLIAATVVYRTSNQRQTTSSSASAISIASDINNTWSKVKPINNVFPWTDGGPTASWERYLPSINLNRLGICNKKYCWVYDRATETWGSGFDMSTSPDFAVQPGPGNIYPWSNNGPTAAWTWVVKSNDPATFFNKPNGTDILETIICNKIICWRSIRYPGTPPSGVPANKWRDGGVGKDLHHLNSFWEDTRVAGLWTGDGLTSALTNPNTKEATLCNHSYCWTLNYANWTWGQRMTSFPVGVNELTSTWISQTTNWFYLCNGAKCWIKNAATGVYENNGNPVFLHNAPTPTWTPIPTKIPPTATPKPTATAVPTPAQYNLPIIVNTTRSNNYLVQVTAIRSSAPSTAQPVVCLRKATAAGTSGATTVTGTCNGLTRGIAYRISTMALDVPTETPLRPYTQGEYTVPISGTPTLTLNFTMPTTTTTPTVIPTLTSTPSPTPRATAVPTTIPTSSPTPKPTAPTTPPSQRDATINFAVEYSGIASSKTLLPAAETQVKIMNGTTVLKTIEVALQRRSTSNIFAPTQAISVSVPASGINGVTVQIKHLTSTTLTVTGLTLTPGQLSSFSPNGEGKLYGGDVNGFNACTNCSYGLIDSYDLNNFLEALNANRFNTTVDFDRNGIVNLGDFGLIALNYMKNPQTINLRTRDE